MLSGINVLLMPNKHLDPSAPNQTRNESSNHSKQSEDDVNFFQDKTYIQLAVRFAKDYLESAECELIDIPQQQITYLEEKYEEASSYVMKDNESHARRGNKDDESSVGYLHDTCYQSKLDEMIQKGRENSSDKMSAASVLVKS